MDPKKVEAIVKWPVPENVKQVQSYLGFANFYRRFIKDFAKIARPLTELTKKEESWVWTTERQEAFEKLKEATTSAPVLRIPDDKNKIRLVSDASDFAYGGTMYQFDPVTVFPIQRPYWAYGLVCMLLYKSPTSHSSQVDAIAALQSFHIRKSQRLTDLARHI